MAAPIILGQTSGVRVKRTKNWSPQGGLVMGEEWSGQIEAVEAIFNQYAGNTSGVSHASFVSSGAKGICVLSWGDEPTETEVPEIWQVMPNEMEVPIEQHAYFKTADRALMVIAKKENTAGKPCSSTVPLIMKYYEFLANGIDAYIDGGLSLSKSVVVSKRSTLKASYVGCNRVQALAAIGAPTAIIGAVPAGWEWLRKTPQVRGLSQGRYQLTQEWWGAEAGWSTILYGGTRAP